jgi:PAS domain S-box-containing protein
MADNELIKSADELLMENEYLRSRLAEAESALSAIRNGKMHTNDAAGVGEKISSPESAEPSYCEENKKLKSDILELKQSELVLKNTLDRFYLILSNINNGVLLVTDDDRIEFVNQSFCNLFALDETPSELMNISASDLNSRIKHCFKDQENALARISEIVRLGNPVSGEYVEMNSERTLVRHFIPINVGNSHYGSLWNLVDITERKLISDTQDFLLRNNVLGSGEEFFKSLAVFIAKILKMDYVCIDKLEGDNLTATTVAVFNDGKFDPNISYSLKETPCGDVVGETICSFPANVRNLFPNDTALQDLKAESYIGTTLWSFDKKPIGLIAVIGRRPLKNQHLAETVLKLVSIRAAAELERKLSEVVLKESEERFRTIAETVPVLVCVTRFKDSVVLFTNEVNNKAFGMRGEDILGTTGPDYYCNPEDRKKLFELFKKQGYVDNFEVKVKKSDGTPFWIMTSVRKITYHDQTAVIGASIDITKTKEIEEALRQSEEKFRNLVKNAPTSIYELDFINKKFISVNDKMCELSGYSREELLSMNVLDILVDESRALFISRITKCSMGETPVETVEYSVKTKSGAIANAVLSMRFNFDEKGRPIGAMVVAHDITEQKKARDLLYLNEQKLKYHYENSPLAVVEWDADFKILQWSNEAENIFGLRKEDVLGVRIDLLNIIYADDLHLVEKTIGRLTSGKEAKVISQNRNYGKNHEVIDCIWYNSALFDEKGKMSSVLSLVENVTQLKKTEKELIESKKSYEELLANARSIIVKLDTDGIITFINEFGLNFFGFTKEELIGKPAVGTVTPEIESTGRALDKLVDKIVDNPDNYAININENIKKNGERVWIEWHNKAVFDENGIKSGHTAIGIEITERKKAQDNLKESESKLRSVLNATRESIYMFDRNGNIIMVNSIGVKRLKRRSENEVLGRHFSEFLSPATAKFRQEKLDEVFRTGTYLEFEDERGGNIFHHHFAPVCIEDEVVSVVTYSTNITESKTAEVKLKESEDRFRTIAESLTVLISISRIRDMELIFVNEPYEKAFGFTKDELPGKKLPYILCDSNDFKVISDILGQKGSIDNHEIRVKGKYGVPFWINTSIRTINYMDQPSYISASIDITETKRAQEKLIQLNRTLNAHNRSSKTMIHSDNEFEYLDKVCRIIIEDCGYSMVWVGYPQNDRYKTVKPVAYYGFDKGYIDEMKITWSDTNRGRGPTGTAIRTGKPSICKNMLTDPAFKPWRKAALKRGFASSLVLPLLFDGKTFGAVSIYSKEPDKFSEDEVSLLNDLANDLGYGISHIRLLESERATLKIIRESEIKLKELIATKDKFFNIIAHDLKNPFTSILGSSELLYANFDKMNTGNIKNLAFILNESAKAGYLILQNLLDWSRSQTGMLKINPEKINLRNAIQENILNHQLSASTKEIDLYSVVDEDIFITADINMLNTVLRNLISNAIKFSYRNSEVVISAKMKPDEAIISVKDSGVGIEKQRIANLFHLDSKNSMPGTDNEIGTGLGLKLCREFVEKLSGRIWVESIEEKGSKFIFAVPLNYEKVE